MNFNITRHHLATLACLCLVYFLNVLGRMVFSPIAPILASEMGLSHSDAGNIFLIISSGFAISLFSSQFISARISHRKTIILSTLLLGLAHILTSFTTSFVFFRIGLFLIGTGGGLFLPSSVAIVSSIVAKENFGKAFGTFAMSQSTAFIMAPILLQMLHPALSLHAILRLLGVTIFCVGLTLPFLLKGGKFKGETISFEFAGSLLQTPAFWMAIFLLCLVNGLNVGIYNMAPHYFTHSHLISEDKIHTIIVIARFIGIFVALLGGFISDYLGLKKAIPLGFFFCGMMTFFMGSLPSNMALSIFCFQAPIAICLTPMVHHYIATLAPPERNASLVSITAPFAFLFGSGIVPQILGLFGDMKLYAFGFVLLGLFTLSTGLSFRFFKNLLPEKISLNPDNET